jgi:hypothetical protein
MKIYKKQSAQYTEYKLYIDTTNTTISYKYHLRKPWLDYEDVNCWSDEPVYTRTCTYEEFKVDHATHQKPQDAHILYGFFDRYRKPTYQHHLHFPFNYNEEKVLKVTGKDPVLLDIIRYTKDSKAGVGDVTQLHGGFPVFLVAIPFKDSAVEDWVFITEAHETYINGALVADIVDVEYKKSLKDVTDKYLPNITLSKEGDEITATLVPAKPNVELHFETTVGTLSAQRGFTDANGKVKTTITADTNGKVKVGFKHFSGKAEIAV